MSPAAILANRAASRACWRSRRRLVRGDKLRLTSDKLNGKIALLVDLVTGRFDIAHFGRHDPLPDPRARHRRRDQRAAGRARAGRPRLAGHRQGQAWVRRLDNSFFRDSPAACRGSTTDLERGTDGIVHFTNLQLYCAQAPADRRAASATATAPSTSTRAAGRRNTGR